MLPLFFSWILSFALAADTAVVIVDMEPRFFTRPAFADPMIERQIELLKWAKERGYPVLVFEYQGYDPTFPALMEVIETFEQTATVSKSEDGGFHRRLRRSEDPAKILKSWGVKRLILCGINGPYCMRDTAIGALRKGFDVYAAADLMGDFADSNETLYSTQDEIRQAWRRLKPRLGRVLRIFDHWGELTEASYPPSRRECWRHFVNNGFKRRL